MQALKEAPVPASFLDLFDLKAHEESVVFSRSNIFTATICNHF